MDVRTKTLIVDFAQNNREKLDLGQTIDKAVNAWLESNDGEIHSIEQSVDPLASFTKAVVTIVYTPAVVEAVPDKPPKGPGVTDQALLPKDPPPPAAGPVKKGRKQAT